MQKAELKKNRFDLEYKFESQKAIICFTAMTITLLGILGVMIYKGEYIIGTALVILALLYTSTLYKKIKKRLDEILEELENIKN